MIVMGHNIGNFLGMFLDYDHKHNSNPWMNFMQIRVLVDVNKPQANEEDQKRR